MAALLRSGACAALLWATRQARTGSCVAPTPPHRSAPSTTLIGTTRTKKTWPVVFSPEELKKRLSPMQYHVTQEKGTESAFRGEFTHHKEDGTYTCVVCGTPLFTSSTKFDSGSGWPAFSDLAKEGSVTLTDDYSLGMHRVETTCSQCGAHLGHLFEDGPRPTRNRYCINSASLAFQGGEGGGVAAVATETAPSGDDGPGGAAGTGGGPKKEL